MVLNSIPLQRSALRFTLALLLPATAFAQEAQAEQAKPAVVAPLQHHAAARLPQPQNEPILGAARAGKRLIAVGDRGLVMLSDDNGRTYRQAQAVPTRATLTSVWAADDTTVWAVGHWGVMLVSTDAGEHWALARSELQRDQPLLSVWFADTKIADARTGIAAGLFSLLLITDDGVHWREARLPALPGGKADLNLFQVFGDRQGGIWIAAEQGTVYRSADRGKSWAAIATGNKGSLWSGVALDDGSIVVGGLQGKILRSVDQGKTWVPARSATKNSITALVALPGQKILALALGGTTMVSEDGGASFVARPGVDRRAFTAAVLDGNGKPVLFSQTGVASE